MKLLYFIKWCWNNFVATVKSWDQWMWGWMITCGWGPTAFMNRVESPESFHYFMIFVLVFWVAYGFIYTGIKRLYRKFQDEQERMVEHLKDIG